MTPSAHSTDPDRFFDRTSPGAHEWWYFDAISRDGRDVLVVVWYAGLPFDPSYGVATLRHLKDPSRHLQPRALDHSAVGFSWHRDGKPMAYALNGYKADRFRHQAEPFAVEVGASRVERDGSGYLLTLDTPTVEGKPIRAEIRFHPADSTEPFERDLGTPGAPHDWILAAGDCRVEGAATIGDDAMTFLGRGYHDHNAGAEDLSVAMKRWEWGRVHRGDRTDVYYASSPHRGATRELWITCRDGRPETVRESADLSLPSQGDDDRPSGRNVFGLKHRVTRGFGSEGTSLLRKTAGCLDDGPFYRRWLAEFGDHQADIDAEAPGRAVGIAELLETKNLHRFWFNWMIPYRLKWPRA